MSGDKRLPIPQQAPAAFNALEALLPTLKKKRFYGAVIDGEYRACVAVDNDTRGLDLPLWVLPSGRYGVHKIADWERHRDDIGPTVRIPMPFDPARSRKALQNQRDASVGGLTQIGSLSC